MTAQSLNRCALLMLGALLAGCASTKPLGEWVAPEYDGDAASNVMVIAAVERTTRRRAFEDNLVDMLKASGAEASPSHELMAASLTLSRNALRQAISRRKVDAVLVMRLVLVNEKPYEAPPETPAGALYDYHDRAFESAGKFNRRGPTVIETSLFSAADGQLLWSMQSAVMEPSQPRNFIVAHLRGVVERLRQIGLLDAKPAELSE